jgi:hypothetical protein
MDGLLTTLVILALIIITMFFGLLFTVGISKIKVALKKDGPFIEILTKPDPESPEDE